MKQLRILNYLLLISTCLFGITACSDSAEDQRIHDQQVIQDYIEANNLTNVESTESGLHYVIKKPGSGNEHPALNSRVVVHYEGKNVSNVVFDSSYQRGEPAEFNLGQLILGWQEGIPLLKKGGEMTLLIPSHLGYGERGSPPAIPPNVVLVFDLELVDFF